jgi:RING finger protein 113A
MSESFGFAKRSIKNKFARKRKQSSDEEKQDSSENDEKTSSSVVRPDKKKYNPNFHSSSISKKEAKKQKGSDSESNKESDEEIVVKYKSKRLAESDGPRDQGATAEVIFETSVDRDATALFKKSIEINKELEGKADDKIYRGMNNYTQYYKKKDTAAGNAGSGINSVGPMRAPTNLRSTVRWDYQPDICKDYKETGFCGFGDSCKFLHDRSDFKYGWQLELEERAKNSRTHECDSDDDDKKYEIHSDEDDLPFKCLICRKSFVNPIMTKCNHYFCEKCALERFKKTTRCFVCSAQTSGVFNPARKLMERLKMVNDSDSEDEHVEKDQEEVVDVSD